MIRSKPSRRQLDQWRKIWEAEREKLEPNRKSGRQLLDYLRALYTLEPADSGEILEIIAGNVTGSSHCSGKLPHGAEPEPAAFFVLDRGNGSILYQERDALDRLADRILVGVDMASGCYHVEGSERLWDELCAYQGLDAADIENYVCGAQYVQCAAQRDRIIGYEVEVTVDRALGTRHPQYPDMIYPVNYGFVEGILGGDGEFQDAYILGIDHPVERFEGRVAAVIHRTNDNEDKWVVLPRGAELTREEIEAQIDFQERFFTHDIVM